MHDRSDDKERMFAKSENPALAREHPVPTASGGART
jgi:hypothetical protein